MTIPVSMVSTVFIHIHIVGGSPLVRGLVRPSYKRIFLLLTLLVNGVKASYSTLTIPVVTHQVYPLITYILAELHQFTYLKIAEIFQDSPISFTIPVTICGHYHGYLWHFMAIWLHIFPWPKKDYQSTAVTIYHLPDTINVLVQRWVDKKNTGILPTGSGNWVPSGKLT